MSKSSFYLINIALRNSKSLLNLIPKHIRLALNAEIAELVTKYSLKKTLLNRIPVAVSKYLTSSVIWTIMDIS